MESDTSHRLIDGLRQPRAFGHEVRDLRVIETHISWVVLTGAVAYKIKKPVDLGFVDFSTLAKREHFCGEELRLNRRLAAELYLDVVPITGTLDAPVVDGDGEPIEFAVRMRQFPQEALLSSMLERGELTAAHIDALADEIAAFHRTIAVAGSDSPFGTPRRVWQPVGENFRHLEALNLGPVDHSTADRISRLHEWSLHEFEVHGDAGRAEDTTNFAFRKQSGSVRECHGDMHLGNMIVAGPGETAVTIFDCIEFNEGLRWIDVMSEAAFVVMDLEDRGRADFARRCLNRYLELTGDYAGLVVLPFYLVYRALVRAKVASLRLSQGDLAPDEREKLRDDFGGYLQLAESYTQPAPPRLWITHGLSGSGKTFGTQSFVESNGAIRIRSDIERKRMFGLNPLASSGSHVGDDLYSSEATERTYARLEELAESIVTAGYAVVVDATFLRRSQRNAFRRLAERLGVPFQILDFQAPEETLRSRIAVRAADASEATLEVLEHQLAKQEPLGEDELGAVVVMPHQ